MWSPDPAENKPEDRPEERPVDRPDDRRDVEKDRDPVDYPTGPTTIESVPWYRQNSVCSALLVAHVFIMCLGGCVPIVSLLGTLTTVGVILVCVIVLTGPVYYNKRKKDGTLKTWSKGNKIAAIILLILFVGGYIALITLLVLNGKFG